MVVYVFLDLLYVYWYKSILIVLQLIVFKNKIATFKYLAAIVTFSINNITTWAFIVGSIIILDFRLIKTI